MELDRWALMRLDNVIQKAHEGYEAFDFHIVFHAIHNYCTTDLSNFYLDIIKDRLYCEKEDSVERRAAQTTIYRILSALTRLIAPILSFTAEEIWSYLPHAASDDAKSVFLNEMPKASGLTEDADFMAKWDLIYQTRMDANKVLEEKRNEKLIGKSLEAKVTISVADDAQYAILSDAADVLAKVLIVSEVSVVKAESGDTTYTVERAAGEKCERCWMYLDSVGKHAAHLLWISCNRERKHFVLIAAIIIIILLTAADQLIKYWAIQELKPVGTMPFLHIGDKKILDLTYLENNGAVFSSFAGMRWLLVGTTVVLMAFCAYWLVRHGKKSKLMTVSLTLILGGGLGNLIDRLFRGGLVVDYFEVKLFRFAVFNFADCCVVVGVILFAVYFLFIEPKLSKKDETAPKKGDKNHA